MIKIDPWSSGESELGITEHLTFYSIKVFVSL
jgi:hypothetical protein